MDNPDSAPEPNKTTNTVVVEANTPSLPGWLPSDFFTALQSASYIIVLCIGYVFVSSKEAIKKGIEKHFEDVTNLKKESAENLKLTRDQHDTIAQLTENNNTLTSVIAKHIEGVEIQDSSNTDK